MDDAVDICDEIIEESIGIEESVEAELIELSIGIDEDIIELSMGMDDDVIIDDEEAPCATAAEVASTAAMAVPAMRKRFI